MIPTFYQHVRVSGDDCEAVSQKFLTLDKAVEDFADFVMRRAYHSKDACHTFIISEHEDKGDGTCEWRRDFTVDGKPTTHFNQVTISNIMNTDYQKQGTDFLKKHGIRMTTKFEGSRPYFNDDKQPRDVFKVSFTRLSARLNIEFGQGINDSDGKGGKPPTAYDVLACIEKYQVEGFDSWVEEYGYDEVPKGKKWTVHYRECHDMHRRCKEQWAKVSKFFSTKELDELREIN